jgi:hypothetical protein
MPASASWHFNKINSSMAEKDDELALFQPIKIAFSRSAIQGRFAGR